MFQRSGKTGQRGNGGSSARCAAALTATAALAVGAVLTASPAQAQEATARVLELGGIPLNVRAEPTLSGTVVDTVNAGQQVTIACQATGPEVHNDIDGYTSTLWDYLPEHGGYVSDAWIYTGYNGPVPGVPTCGEENPDPDPDPGSGGCPDAVPFPGGSLTAAVDAMESKWHLDFVDSTYSWTAERYRPVIEVWWNSLEKVGCTGFLDTVADNNSGELTVVAVGLGGWWGEYLGYSTGVPRQDIDIEAQRNGIDGSGADQVEWNVIHELAHSVNNDRSDDGDSFASPGYWSEFGTLHRQYGPITTYGAEGGPTESIADIIGYYVDRCGGEWSAPNPYDADNAATHAYFGYVKDTFFNGHTFGPEAGQAC